MKIDNNLILEILTQIRVNVKRSLLLQQRHSIVGKLHVLRNVSSVGAISESRLNTLIVGNRSSLLQKMSCYVNWIMSVRN